MASKKRGGGESKAPLIVTLILSLMLNLGLGIAVYMYGSEEDANAKLAKDEKNKNAQLTQERDQYRHLAHMSLAYMGLLPQGDDLIQLGVDRDKYKDQAKNPQAAKPLQQLAALEQYAGQTFGWDTAAKKPKKTVQDVLGQWQKSYNALQMNANALAQAKQAAEGQVKDLDEQLKAATREYKKSLDNLSTQAKKDRDTDRQTIEDQRTKLGQAQTEAGRQLKAKQKEVDAQVATVKQRDEEISNLKVALKARENDLEGLRAKLGDAPKTLRTDWKVVRVDPLGDDVYINLGSTDKLKPLLTFAVHGVIDGRVNPKSKATIEVVQVIGPHLSKAQVTSVKDEPVNPVMRGDVLYNPTWNPRLKKHVAIAGIIDLDSDGRDDSVEFRRNLERQDVVVDAYLDLKDFKVKGRGITVRTDWLILGGGLDYLGGGGPREQEFYANVEKAIEAMQQKAKDTGVEVIGLRKYLEQIGYRLPPSKEERVPTSIYSPGYNPRARRR
jgi:hypothetical protein